jgi:uncharacterized protein (DUF1800 family)
MSLDKSLEAAIAVHRFGLGARPGELRDAAASPRTWLMGQLNVAAEQPKAIGSTPLMSGGDLVVEMIEYIREAKAAKDDPVKRFINTRVPIYVNEMSARFAQGITTQKPFAERLVWFWSNHFVVSAQNPRALVFVGAFEREAIRPHINGKFEDMLLAVVGHPAMLLYLDNAQSVGPDSMGGKLGGKGLNENLGRELMELYTLGVDGGYSQDDVIALAKILTGWSIDKSGANDGFRYYAFLHEPGEFTLRGKTYASGQEGGLAALHDLARDPATARHIARKFATQFIADNPSPQSVARLEKCFNETGGDLRALAETAVNDPAAWTAGPGKLRTPVEYVTASLRLTGWPHGGDEEKQIKGVMAGARLMGEFPLAAPSPKGWPDNSDAWSGPDAVLNRIEWARELGNRLPAQGFDALAAADDAMGPLLHPATRAAMTSAANPGEAVALLIASPEFQRR